MAVVAPAVPAAARIVFRRLMIPFAVLAGYFVAWGVVFCMDAIIRALFGQAAGLIAHIPIIGRTVSDGVHYLGHRLSSELGKLENYFENQMASRWHALAGLVTQYARDVEAAALYDWQLAKKLATVYGLAASGKLGPTVEKWLRSQLAKIHGATTVITVVKRVVEHPTVGKIGGAIATGVRPIAHLLSDVVLPDIAGLRDRTKTVEGQVARLWRALRKREGAIATGLAIAAFVSLLRRFGLNWIRCNSVKSLGRRVCRMHPGLLDALLLDTLLIAGTISIVELAEELLAVEDELVGLVKRGFRELRDVDVPSAAEAIASGEW